MSKTACRRLCAPRLFATFIILSSCLTLLPAYSDAAGFFLPMRGIRPMGRAGAVTVSGAGTHALWYNPAAMHTLEGTHIMVETAIGFLSTSFQRTPRLEPNGDLVTYDEVNNDKPPDIIPSFAITSDFGIDQLVLGFAVFPPFGARYTYPEDGPQRYAAVRNDAALYAMISVGASFQITDWLAVGASFQNLFFDMTLIATASAYEGLFGYPEDRDLDLLMKVHTVDPFSPSGSIGIWAAPLPELELAISFQLPSHIEDNDAELEVRLPSNPAFDGTQVEGDTVSGGFDLPAVIRAGVRYVQPRWDVEINFVWEGWSTHDAIRTTPRNVVITGIFHVDEFVVGPLTVNQDYENTVAISVGGDYEVIPDVIALRAGLSFEQGAVPDHRLSSFQMDMDKLTPTVGLTWMIPEAHLEVDFGYAHFFFFDTQISDSHVEQINPTFEDGALVVGNGFYQASIDFFGIGLEAIF